jgi:hypothetical protein
MGRDRLERPGVEGKILWKPALAHYYPALGSYWLAREARREREGSEPMGTGQHPSLLPSGPYIIVIPTDR